MIVRHPRLAIVREVVDPGAWVAQGWVVVDPPMPPKPKPRRRPRR